MSDVDSDRKRRATEMDSSTVVVPKKKFLAQVEAAASEVSVKPEPTNLSKAASGSSSASGHASGSVKDEPGAERPIPAHSTSFSIRDNAPAGARPADDEENVRFQNAQLYAANQAHRNEIQRLNCQIESLQCQSQKNIDALSCVQRHWLCLTEELKRTFQRLERTKSTVDDGSLQSILAGMLESQLMSSSDLDSKLSAACLVAQELMQEVVQAFMDCDARLNSLLCTEGKDMPAAAKAEIDMLIKRGLDQEKSVSELQQEIRLKTVQEASQGAEISRLTAANELLQQHLDDVRSQLQVAERRLVRSEENYRLLSSGKGVRVGSELNSDGMDRDGSDGNDYRALAESRLQEVKDKMKLIGELQEQLSLNESSALTDQAIVQSPLYTQATEQLNRARKECEYHVHKLHLVTVELGEMRDRMAEERTKLEALHNAHMKEQLSRYAQVSNSLLEAKQEIRSLQFKLDQKNASEISSKRADELSENMNKLQEEYKRLRAECDALKQRPDAEDLRREFREREEKIAKERDVKQIEANDYLDQIRTQERKIAMLMGRNGESGSHNSNGIDGSAQREIDALKKDLEALRNERKDLQRRFLKADRGFNDCNKLYQQVKKEKDALMKDLESLGLSFEEMQEQNVRLLHQMKTRDEEQNELLKQRMKDRAVRETMAQEMTALRSKLDKAEDLVRIKEDCIDKCKIEMEQLRQEFLKKKKEEECEAAVIAAHRLNLQKKEQAAMEAKRDGDKARTELNEHQRKKREQLQAVQELQFENRRLEEENAALKNRVQSQNSERKLASVNADHMQLLDHYRSRVKCHCRQDDKARVFPCGHATCVKCCERDRKSVV